MVGVFCALRSELSALLGREGEAFLRTRQLPGRVARVDGYVEIVRRVLRDSSLCYVDGVLSFFDGRSYCALTPRELSLILANLLPGMGVGATDIRNMGDMPFSVIFERNFAADRDKVCFANCVYDVRRGRAYQFGRDHVTDYRLPYEYDAAAVCPRWEAFLAEVLPDAAERACLQEFFGMCYVDRERYSIEKMALFVGTGANGKSVIFDVMKRVIGKEWVSFLSPDQLIDNKQLVSVAGKRLNFAPDIRRSSSFDSGLKALSSAQDVQGWRIYEGSVVVKCPPLVFAFNEMPYFRDGTEAFFRRLMPFRFDVVIPPERQNRRLADEICESELPGVFRWVMEGRRRLLGRKGAFTRCARIEDAVESLKRRVRGERRPVLAYLESIGYAARPQYDGQPFEKVTASRIYEGMGGRISKDAITRELNTYQVAKDRGTEVRYFLYRICTAEVQDNDNQ